MLAAPISPQAIEYSERLVQPWRVLRLRTGHESLAAQHLQLRGVAIFIPMCKVVRRLPNRAPFSESRPMLPGYGICLVPRDQREAILTAPAVIDILKHELPEEDYQRLQTLESLPQTEPWETIPHGSRIRVCSGPLTGTVGTLMKRNGESSIIVEIVMLQRLVRTKLNGWDVERA